MMGNFSFGDYFKEYAIAYSWELITSPQWFGISKDKLYVTVFGGAEVAPGTFLNVDEEARGFWREQNVPAERIVPIPGLKDNFWAMGDTGPCGPCSEIFYDMGPAASEEGHPDCKFPCDCGRYVEIWNLVFMQFNRYCRLEGFSEGHGDSSSQLEIKLIPARRPPGPEHKHGPDCLEMRPLPKPSVDTGMGLERVAAVLQGVISNYDTDLFTPIMTAAAKLLDHDQEDADQRTSRQIIADHSRAATFLISEGVIPSNEGRGGVLRKIINRAFVNMGSPENLSDETFPAMAETVTNLMGGAYPELRASLQSVRKVLAAETVRFRRTMTTGLGKLQEEITALEKAQRDEHARTGSSSTVIYHTALPGDVAFRLYDTFGVPWDTIEEAVRVHGGSVDRKGFDRAMREQRERGRASWKGGAGKESANPAYGKLAETFKTELCFYHDTAAKDCRIEAILGKNGPVSELNPGEAGEVVLDRTVIYAESGGQIADTGWFYDPSGSQQVAEVTGAFYPVAGLVTHKVKAKETLRVGDRVSVVADADRREHIKRHHTGTHLVHAALRNILGTHVKQAGSLNGVGRLRFDFSHFAPIDAEELRDIEQQVNEEIRLNTEIETKVTSIEDALASGALAFFGDKYPENNVRVVTITDSREPRGFYSKELCGGTHVKRIGDIGVLKIVNEESVAAGVRRIEAVAGTWALEHYQRQAAKLGELAARLNVGEDALLQTVEKLSATAKQLEKELDAQKRKGALGQVDELIAQAQTVKGVKLIAAEVASVDREGLRALVDTLRQKLGSGVVALGMPEDGKVALIAGVTKDLTSKVHAGKLIQALAKQLGGSGGGRPDLAEAGGKDTAGLKSALSGIPAYLDPLL
jgi:alanyl-tRNA synthetase